MGKGEKDETTVEEALPRESDLNNERSKKIGSICCIAVVVGLVGGFLAWWLTRPSNIDNSFANDAHSPWTLEYAAAGIVRIDSRVFLANETKEFAATLLLDEVPPNATLYLTVEASINSTQNLEAGQYIAIPGNTSYPFFLPSDLPVEDLRYGFLTNENGDSDNNTESFSFVLDLDGAIDAPSQDFATLQSVSLSGSSGYRVRGSISFTSRVDFENGNPAATTLVRIPYMQLENIESPNAPGPQLYLSTRPHERGMKVDGAADLYLPIQGTPDESYSKDGNFWQDLPQGVDWNTFDGGAVIVWCEPFSVYLGGGSLVAL